MMARRGALPKELEEEGPLARGHGELSDGGDDVGDGAADEGADAGGGSGGVSSLGGRRVGWRGGLGVRVAAARRGGGRRGALVLLDDALEERGLRRLLDLLVELYPEREDPLLEGDRRQVADLRGAGATGEVRHGNQTLGRRVTERKWDWDARTSTTGDSCTAARRTGTHAASFVRTCGVKSHGKDRAPAEMAGRETGARAGGSCECCRQGLSAHAPLAPPRTSCGQRCHSAAGRRRARPAGRRASAAPLNQQYFFT